MNIVNDPIDMEESFFSFTFSFDKAKLEDAKAISTKKKLHLIFFVADGKSSNHEQSLVIVQGRICPPTF